MAKFYNLCSFLISSYIFTKCISSAQNNAEYTSPCPEIFQYSSPGSGQITVPSPKIGEILLVQVEFVIFDKLTSDDVVSLSLLKTKDETLQLIVNGASNIQYILRFPSGYGQPQITQISYNGNVICSSTTDDRISGPRSNIKVHSLLSSRQMFGVRTNSTMQPPRQSTNRITTEKPVPNVEEENTIEMQQPVEKIVTPNISPVPPPSSVRDEDICGTVDRRYQTTPLIFGGQNIRHGTWPWQAAIFTSNSFSLNYKCGGTLVSNRVVISAAHCFVNGGSTISATKINVHLGRHNLHIWEEVGQQRRQVTLVKIHDDYMKSDSGTFDADIAVLVLKRIVDYNEYVRPICLWFGNNQLRNVEGKLGTIIGWGLSESQPDNAEPKKITIPIVSQETCLRNSPDSFKRITSDRTFCAGYRNGTGPCNGDSGSGLAIQQNNKWALRGIVSVSAAIDALNAMCDLSQYVVFTDAALFKDFISEYVTQ